MTLQNVKLLNLFKYIVKRGRTALASSDNCEKESILILKKKTTRFFSPVNAYEKYTPPADHITKIIANLMRKVFKFSTVV